MGFRLASIDDRAALVDDTAYYDVASISGGGLGPDPMEVIGQGAALHDLAGRLSELEPTGSLDGVELGPPVPRPRNSFGIGLNYRAHVADLRFLEARQFPKGTRHELGYKYLFHGTMQNAIKPITEGGLTRDKASEDCL